MTPQQQQFLVRFNAEVSRANNRPEGADYLGICNRLAQEYGMEPREAWDIVKADVADILGAG